MAKYLDLTGLQKYDEKIKKHIDDTKADDSEVVHLTGDETIAGTKTFSGTTTNVNKQLIFSDTANPYIKMTSNGTPYYFQAASGQFGLGPTWAKATRWYSDGSATVYGPSLTAPKLIEGSTSLSDKYLGKTAKAADADKLDGNDSSYYLNYNNLTNKPNIPTVNNPKVTIKQGESEKGSFTLNQSDETIIELDNGEPKFITLTGTSGTLTAEQRAVLTESINSYVINNNDIFRRVKSTESGYLTYEKMDNKTLYRISIMEDNSWQRGSLLLGQSSKITITQGGIEKGSFTLNQGGNDTIELDAGGGSVDDSNYAKLDSANTFTKENTFSQIVTESITGESLWLGDNVYGNYIRFDTENGVSICDMLAEKTYGLNEWGSFDEIIATQSYVDDAVANAGGGGGGTAKIIELSGVSGTLTDEQRAILDESIDNGILYSNRYYRLGSYGDDYKVYLYTNNAATYRIVVYTSNNEYYSQQFNRGDATITFKKNGSTLGSFDLDSHTDKTINLGSTVEPTDNITWDGDHTFIGSYVDFSDTLVKGLAPAIKIRKWEDTV